MKYAIPELIDLPRLHQLMETLFQATGINHALIGCDGVVYTGVGWQEICTGFHRVHPTTCARCLESDRNICSHLQDAAYAGCRCPQGLVDYAAPLIIEGEHLANVFTGQMLHAPPDEGYFKRQAQEYGFDQAAYLEALRKVPVIPEERMPAIMAFQVELAQMLASNGLVRLRQLEAERELQQTNRSLAQRTVDLEAANQELEEFSYSISHDLRTPLRAIDGFCRILLEDYGERLDEEGKRLFKVVRDNTKDMGQLIDAILVFLRLGRQKMAMEAVDMAQLAGEAFAGLDPDAGRPRLDIRPLPPAWGDRAMLRQVLANLLSNAVKFSRERPDAAIEIGGTADAGGNSYYVKDNGVGFDMQYVGKLFRVFERVHPRGQFEGTGTGLAMVKRIIGRHGGRVWAEGKVNEGATIHFTLPVQGATT